MARVGSLRPRPAFHEGERAADADGEQLLALLRR